MAGQRKTQCKIAAFYHFVKIEDPGLLQQSLLARLEADGIKGTILVAGEGVNGTIAGTVDAVDSFLAWLAQDSRFAGLRHKASWAGSQPFHRTRVKLKREIVTLGVTDLDPAKTPGTYVHPRDWNQLISDPDLLLIDTRNDYEVEIGTFEGAVNPRTSTFREFPDFVARSLDPSKHRKVAMFCTGGIRCEKSTAYLKSRGFDEVYHLEGGILNYLETVPQSESLWRGECFVFDERVTVDHDLAPGRYDQCHACRRPISEEDKQLDSYQPGVSCRHCIDSTTESQRQAFQERERQVQLAAERGESHLGGDARQHQEVRRRKKDRSRRRLPH